MGCQLPMLLSQRADNYTAHPCPGGGDDSVEAVLNDETLFRFYACHSRAAQKEIGGRFATRHMNP